MTDRELLVKLEALIEYKQRGYLLEERDGVVYARRNGNVPVPVLVLDSDSSREAWEVFLGKRPPAEIPDGAPVRVARRSGPGESLASLRKELEELAERLLGMKGVVTIARLLERAGDGDEARRRLAVSVLVEVASRADGKRFRRVGIPAEAVVDLELVPAPWIEEPPSAVYTSSFCYNPARGPGGRTILPLEEHPVKVEVEQRGKRYPRGRVVWSQRAELVGRVAFFSRYAGDIRPGAVYWSYSYRVGSRGAVWIYRAAPDEGGAARQREELASRLPRAGHVVPAATYGVDEWFKPYRVDGLPMRRGEVYAIPAAGDRFAVRAGRWRGKAPTTPGAGRLLESFESVASRFNYHFMDELAYIAVARGSSVGAVSLGAVASLHTIHNTIMAHGGRAVQPYYFVTAISPSNLAVRRLFNYSRRGLGILLREIGSVVDERAVIRVSSMPVRRRSDGATVRVFHVNIVVSTSDEHLGSVVSAVNLVNKTETSWRVDDVGVARD